MEAKKAWPALDGRSLNFRETIGAQLAAHLRNARAQPMQKIYFGLAFPLAVAAALVYHSGYQEIAASIWFISLILLMPIMRKQA
jgi:hypothetical protein